MDIQPVFNEYKAVTYMCQYFSKTDNAHKPCNKRQKRPMRTIRIITMNYHILPELKLRRIFPAVYFFDTNLPEERVQVLLSENKLSKLPDDSPNIFKKSNIDLYVERPCVTFCNEKYSALNDFCYAKFLAYSTLKNKSSNSCEYQPDELDDNLMRKIMRSPLTQSKLN